MSLSDEIEPCTSCKDFGCGESILRTKKVKQFIKELKEEIRNEGDKHHIVYEIEAIDELAGEGLI